MVYHRCLLCNTGSTKKKEMPPRKKRVVRASVKPAPKSKRRSRDCAALNTSKKLKVVKEEPEEGNVTAYCWICHKVGQDQVCACKKGYHNECLGISFQQFKDNNCPECQLKSVDGTELTKSFVGGLKFYLASAVKWMKEYYKKELLDCFQYDDVNLIVPTMDIETLLKKTQADSYKTTAEFYTDVKEFYHECCILYGENSNESKVAKKISKDLREELVDMEACPDCYYHLYCKYFNIYGFEDSEKEVPGDDSFFVRLCDPPHDIVWAKVAGHSHWPAKVLKIINGRARVRFFGKHEKAEIPINLIFHISETHPVYERRSLNSTVPRTSIDYACAKRELMKYISLYEENIGKFKFFELRMFYGLTSDPSNNENVGMPPTVEEVGPEMNNTQLELISNADSIAQEPPPVSALTDENIENFNNAIAGPSNIDISDNAWGLFIDPNPSMNSYDLSSVTAPIPISETLPVPQMENNQSTPIGSPTEVFNTSSTSISSSFSSETLSAISCSSAPTSSSNAPTLQDFQIKEELGDADPMSFLPRSLTGSSNISQILEDLFKSSATSGGISTPDTFISSLLSSCASSSNIENAPSTSFSVPGLPFIKAENFHPSDSVPSTSGIQQPQSQVFQNSGPVDANPGQKLPEKEIALIDLTEDDDEESPTAIFSNILVENPQINNLYQQTHKVVETFVSHLCAEIYKRQAPASALLCNELNDKIIETEKKFHEETAKLKDEIKRLQRSLNENK